MLIRENKFLEIYSQELLKNKIFRYEFNKNTYEIFTLKTTKHF